MQVPESDYSDVGELDLSESKIDEKHHKGIVSIHQKLIGPREQRIPVEDLLGEIYALKTKIETEMEDDSDSE